LSGRGLCDELITRPEESHRLWCVVVCDLETSRMRRPWPALGYSATKKKLAVLWKSSALQLNEFPISGLLEDCLPSSWHAHPRARKGKH